MSRRLALKGMKFGKLTVIEQEFPHSYNGRWWVQCDCGSPRKTVSGMSLTSGNTKSCGCLRSENRGRPAILPKRKKFIPLVRFLDETNMDRVQLALEQALSNYGVEVHADKLMYRGTTYDGFKNKIHALGYAMQQFVTDKLEDTPTLPFDGS